jgi:hypothetical protein
MLTAMANALRVGDHVLERLGPGKSASLAAQPGTGLGRRMCSLPEPGKARLFCASSDSSGNFGDGMLANRLVT